MDFTTSERARQQHGGTVGKVLDTVNRTGREPCPCVRSEAPAEAVAEADGH